MILISVAHYLLKKQTIYMKKIIWYLKINHNGHTDTVLLLIKMIYAC